MTPPGLEPYSINPLSFPVRCSILLSEFLAVLYFFGCLLYPGMLEYETAFDYFSALTIFSLPIILYGRLTRRRWGLYLAAIYCVWVLAEFALQDWAQFSSQMRTSTLGLWFASIGAIWIICVCVALYGYVRTISAAKVTHTP